MAVVPPTLSKSMGVLLAVISKTVGNWDWEVAVASSWYCELLREPECDVSDSGVSIHLFEIAGSIPPDCDCGCTGGGGAGVFRASWASVFASRS